MTVAVPSVLGLHRRAPRRSSRGSRCAGPRSRAAYFGTGNTRTGAQDQRCAPRPRRSCPHASSRGPPTSLPPPPRRLARRCPSRLALPLRVCDGRDRCPSCFASAQHRPAARASDRGRSRRFILALLGRGAGGGRLRGHRRRGAVRARRSASAGARHGDVASRSAAPRVAMRDVGRRRRGQDHLPLEAPLAPVPMQRGRAPARPSASVRRSRSSAPRPCPGSSGSRYRLREHVRRLVVGEGEHRVVDDREAASSAGTGLPVRSRVVTVSVTCRAARSVLRSGVDLRPRGRARRLRIDQALGERAQCPRRRR